MKSIFVLLLLFLVTPDLRSDESRLRCFVGSDALSSTEVSQHADSLRSEVRLARMQLNPSAVLEAETAYQSHLSNCSQWLANSFALQSQSDSLTRSGFAAPPMIRNLIKHLLIARDPVTENALAKNWQRESKQLDPDGELSFWAGLTAYENGEWSSAVTLLRLPVIPMLRNYADKMLFNALYKTDPDAAGAEALHLVQLSADHPFRNQLILRAAHYLINQNKLRESRDLLQPWIKQLTSPPLRARAYTIIAESHLRHGDNKAFLRAAAMAASSSLQLGEETSLRLNHAERILHSRRRDARPLTGCCLNFLIHHGPAKDVYSAWKKHARHLSRSDSITVAKTLLGRLYGSRANNDLLELVSDLTNTSLPLQQLSHLYAARVGRRLGNQDLLESHFHLAAASDSPTTLVTKGEKRSAAQALWELGREKEDRGQWQTAGAVFCELARRFPNDKNARSSSLRSALCQYRAGDQTVSLNCLNQLCQEASPRQLGGPHLWRGLLSDKEDISSYLQTAAEEVYPGYFALRAAAALQTGYDPREDFSDSLFWSQLTGEIRDSTAWFWPAGGPGGARSSAREIITLIEGNPSAEAGMLFRAFGYNSWAAEMWTDLPGVNALSHRERATLRRGLGHFYQGISLGFRNMKCLEARYPIAYAPEINQAAQRFSLSPAFLLAVIRQESMLEPVGRSGVGATGLMQLMPATASRLSRVLNSGQMNLERPEHNILLGAAHLDELLVETGGSVPAALAAYNGGLSNARRWLTSPALDENSIDWDLYIEGITYGETRRFVKSVLMHYWCYLNAYPPPGPANEQNTDIAPGVLIMQNSGTDAGNSISAPGNR